MRFAAVTLILMQTACQTFLPSPICHFGSKGERTISGHIKTRKALYPREIQDFLKSFFQKMIFSSHHGATYMLAEDAQRVLLAFGRKRLYVFEAVGNAEFLVFECAHHVIGQNLHARHH